MWKSATTKIFLSFALIVLVTISLCIFSFSKLILEQQENSLYEIVSSRSISQALTIEAALKNQVPIEKVIQGQPMMILTKELDLLSSFEHFMAASSIRLLAPPTGTLVTKCTDQSGRPHLCAFVPIESISGWLVEVIPLYSFLESMVALAKKMTPYLLALVSFALILAFLLSRLVYSPLKQFITAARMISAGEYDRVKVPEDRKDELAELATAFSKMRFEIQDRERRLARTGVKLAHSARLASIGQLGASIAHEIKNPLTIIKGHARILKDQLADNPLSESARMIWEQSDRCNHILNQMLRFSRNDNEEIKPVQMTELLQSTLLLLKAEAQKKDSKIELKILDDDLISARPQQTQQVFINLILNSIQAIPQGGKIQIQSQKNHEFMFVDVKDSGPGISFRNQSHLFQPFFTTKPKSEGTGLGLSIAQSLLEDQGGGLELIESRPGCTIFRVSLRLAEMQKLDSAMGS